MDSNPRHRFQGGGSNLDQNSGYFRVGDENNQPLEFEKEKTSTSPSSSRIFWSSYILNWICSLLTILALIIICVLLFGREDKNFVAESIPFYDNTSHLESFSSGLGPGSISPFNKEKTKTYALDIERLLYVGCTDIPPAPGKQSLRDSAIFVRYCDPVTSNPCLINSCNTTSGECETNRIDGAQCAYQGDCPGGLCNFDSCTCQAIPGSSTGCLTDDDCNLVPQDECRSFFCNTTAGVCQQRILKGGNCWVGTNCNGTDTCNTDTCTCEPVEIVQCQTANDCMNVSSRGEGNCSFVDCVDNECREMPTLECWQNGDCDFDTEVCNTNTCMCQNKFQDVCLVDEDCPNISIQGNCSFYSCDDGKCNLTYTGGCANSGDCLQNEFCNTTSCECELRPLMQCQQNSDCVQDIGTSCLAVECVLGQCRGSKVVPSGCAFNTECEVGEFCNLNTCTCDIIGNQQCQFDSQCPIIMFGTQTIDGDNCLAFRCDNGNCNMTILNDGNCFSDYQCGSGQSCDTSTCMCIPSIDTCESGYDIRELPPPLTLFDLVCGYDIAVSNDLLVQVCIINDPGPTDTFVLESYVRTGDNWVWRDQIITSVIINGIPDLEVASVDIWGNLVAFVGKTATDPQPSSSFLEVYLLDDIGLFVTLLDSIAIPQSSSLSTDVCIWNTTIVAINGMATVYEEVAPNTWNFTQMFNDTIACSMYEETLVLSLDRPSPGSDTWEGYVDTGGSVWVSTGSAESTTYDGNWLSAVIQLNAPASPNFEFLVYSVPTTVPFLLTDVYNAGGDIIQANKFIGPTSSGFINSYNRNVLIGDNIFFDSLAESVNFQNYFPGLQVIYNSIWNRDVAFIIDSGSGNYTAWANFCPSP